MKNIRGLLFGFMALLMIITTACSGSNNAPPANNANAADTSNTVSEQPAKEDVPAPAAEGDAEIRFTWWGDTKRHEIYNAIADLFEKENPNIKIVREFGSWNDYWDKLATQTAGGNAPDVVGMHATQVANYAQRGALLDLTQYVESGVINLDDFPDAVKEVGKLNDQTVMVAQGVTMTGIFYNKGVLEKLGVEPPDFNWTYDEFAAKAKEVKDKFNAKDSWGSNDLSSDLTSVMVYARQKGKNLFNDDGSLGVTKEDMVWWFSFWDKLRKDGITPDAETRAQYATVPLEQSLFVLGKVGFTAVPYNQIPNYQNFIKEGEVHALRRPTDPEGQNGEFIEGAYLSISKSSKHPEAAAKFINFFVNNEEAVKIFKIEQGALGSTKANEIVLPTLDPAQQRAVTAIQDTLEIAGKLPLPPAGQGQVAQALTDVGESMAFGQLTPEQAAEEFVTNAAAILNKK
ncbi:ABC transporter substrate-binding protein [Paenibacillus abyssi]|uniref:Sugar ABC transporter substrate-binding protein n=1 Tax=Paenibacillus abyssi TaxID=1340531 RepID=A0A917FLX8_9BACL|nr:sugar ABC transporter substrate-binding protein [Paenibacillus abyssi]GGF90655.1 sugar ABC transporter substrate-binding protein [Paenibacillus abyssi]